MRRRTLVLAAALWCGAGTAGEARADGPAPEDTKGRADAASAGDPKGRADAAAREDDRARGAPAILLPSVVDDGTRRRPSASEADLSELVTRLDELLRETAQDLGLGPGGASPPGDPSSAALPDAVKATDAELLDLARATGRAVITASVRPSGAEIELRVSLAPPGRRSSLSRAERLSKDDLQVRALVMLRDLVYDADLGPKPRGVPAPLPVLPIVNTATPATGVRSEGRTVLAVNATLFGGMMGFSVERASGSNDPRLLYPLLAVGAGVGLGASLLIANEWDVGTGDAWFLSSGGLWPTVAAHMIYEGRFGGASGHPGPEGDRWAFGVVGGTAGLTLSTLSLALGDMSSGGAVLAHSGGALGLALGGLTEWLARGDARQAPFAGMGYGAAIGWLAAAGAATTRARIAPVRVLSIDLGAVLGGLAGAALASPLVVDGPSKDETRGWVSAIGGGALVGAGVAFWLTRGSGAQKDDRRASIHVAPGTVVLPDLPEVGIVGESTADAPWLPAASGRPCGLSLAGAPPCALQASAAPIFGVRLRGRW